MIVSLSFYGMSTFEGPMMSIKTVNALSHSTDWTIEHVHSGALGWVGLITMGCMYYLIPRLFWRAEMYSVRLITLHFWVATIGIVLYIASMWIAGVMQGLMWRAVSADGMLTYTFVEGVKATYPFYAIRLLGGTLYLGGMLIMAYNVFKTIAQGTDRAGRTWQGLADPNFQFVLLLHRQPTGAPFMAEARQALNPIFLVQLGPGSDRVAVEKQHFGD